MPNLDQSENQVIVVESAKARVRISAQLRPLVRQNAELSIPAYLEKLSIYQLREPSTPDSQSTEEDVLIVRRHTL